MTRWCLHTIRGTYAFHGSQGSVEIAYFSDSIPYHAISFYASTTLAFFCLLALNTLSLPPSPCLFICYSFYPEHSTSRSLLGASLPSRI